MTRPSSPALWIALLLATALFWAAPTAVQAQDAADSPAEEVTEEPEEPRATFSVTLDPANGGGRVTGEAGDFQLEPGQYLLATDGVTIRFRDLVLEAQTIRLDIPDNRITAEGDVVLDEGPQRMVGTTLDYDLDTRTGRITNARASVDPGYFFEGDEIAKTGDATFTIENGVFTSCEGDAPAWSFKTSDASVTIDEYARIRNARLRFGKVPVLYFPYILWPATTERSSGWLIPKPSYSDRRGFHIGLAYYRTLGRSADATFYADLSTKEYQGLGFEYRYTPTENTQGLFESYYLFEPVDQDVPFPIRDPKRELGKDRWKVAWTHESKNLWGDWRGVINLELFSDFDYERDIDRTFDRQTRPFQYSNAFLTSNRGNQSWNVMVDQQIRLDTSGTRATLRQLPEIEYQVRSTRLGSSNIYFDLRSSVNYFFAEFEDPDIQNADGTTTPGDRVSFDYGRLDLAPSVSVPLSNLTWLSAKLTLAGRMTYYTDSLAENPSEPDPVDEPNNDPLPGGSLTRVFPSAALEIVGPSVSKIFETDGKRFSKYKHIIEPRINYVWVDQYDDANRISIFDGIDRFFPQNGVVVSIVNRLLAKPRDEEKGGAFEIASFELAQGYVFDDFDDNPDNDDSEGPLVASFRYNPSDVTSLRAEAVYDGDISQLTSFRLSGGVQVSENFGFGLSYSALWDNDGEETKDQIRFSTQIGLGDRLTLGLEGSYDNLDFTQAAFPDRERWLNRRLVLDYKAECLSWLLEYRETTLGFQPLDSADQKFDDSEIRFSLTLKNVGTFLDINESF